MVKLLNRAFDMVMKDTFFKTLYYPEMVHSNFLDKASYTLPNFELRLSEFMWNSFIVCFFFPDVIEMQALII